jgi:hypothetical protein
MVHEIADMPLKLESVEQIVRIQKLDVGAGGFSDSAVPRRG